MSRQEAGFGDVYPLASYLFQAGSIMRIGILGGTFDPVHLGHLLIAEESRIGLQLDQVLFVPAGRPWLKEGQPLAEASHRVRMVELAIASNPHFRVRLNEVDRPGLTYTVDTLEELRSEVPDGAELYFILGLDAFESFHRWKEPDRILEFVPPGGGQPPRLCRRRTGQAAGPLP